MIKRRNSKGSTVRGEEWQIYIINIRHTRWKEII